MGSLLGAWSYFMARINEPSTHASISSLLMMAGLQLDSGIVHDSLTAMGVLFGMLGFFVKEGKKQ